MEPSPFAVHEARLSNGLEVRILPGATVPVVSYTTFFRVGSRNERPGITGLAHFFEHMMFNGTERFGPREFDRVLESAGGSSNAYTSTDLTVYHDDFASEALPTVIELESDRMQSLRLDPEMLESEREVVKEERRFRVDNDLGGTMDEVLHSLVYQAHPYRWPVIGWMADLDAITREDAVDFYRRHYAPNNALLVIAGKVDVDDTLRRIEAAYGAIPAGPPIPEVVDAEPEPRGERRALVRFPSQAPALMVGFRAPAASSPDVPAVDLLEYVLGGGEASRLVRRLIHEERLATHVETHFSWRIDPGLFVVFVELQPGKDPAKAERILFEELEAVASRNVPAKELARAKRLYRAHFLHELATAGGRAHALGQHEIFLGDSRALFGVLERIDAVRPTDLRKVAASLFDERNRSVVVVPGAGRGA